MREKLFIKRLIKIFGKYHWIDTSGFNEISIPESDSAKSQYVRLFSRSNRLLSTGNRCRGDVGLV